MVEKIKLYLMMGRPGAGKTTAARFIAELTGATHLWTAKIRLERYGRPSFRHSENLALYDHINRMADELMAAGNSVIFDTSFNFYQDRQKLRKIAKEHGAETIVVWVKAPKEVSKKRAMDNADMHDTRILGDMSESDFERLNNKLEAPKKGEEYIELDGVNGTINDVAKKLGL